MHGLQEAIGYILFNQICLAMEESENTALSKAQTLMNEYNHFFLKMDVTVHPTDIQGEMKGYNFK